MWLIGSVAPEFHDYFIPAKQQYPTSVFQHERHNRLSDPQRYHNLLRKNNKNSAKDIYCNLSQSFGSTFTPVT